MQQFPWERADAPEHVKVRQPVMEIQAARGIRHDLPRRRPADELPDALQTLSFGIVVMSHRGCSNGRLSVLLSSIPENYPVTVSSDSIAEEDVAGDRAVCEHHGAAFSHATPWGGRAANAIHCMKATDWDATLYLCDDVWLFPEAVRCGLQWYYMMQKIGIPLAVLGFPGWETYREHPMWGFANWAECLEKPEKFNAVPPNPAFRRCPALYKNPFGACMLINRAAYNDLGGFSPDYWAHDDVFNHKVWLSKKWVNAAFYGRGYMHLGAQSWHHGEAVEFIKEFKDATGMLAEESGKLQVESIYEWRPRLASHFINLGGTPSV